MGSKEFDGEEAEDRSQIGSSTPIILRDGEEIQVYDPPGPAKCKGRPKNASRFKSGIETSIANKEVKQRKYGNFQGLGHYRTSCPLMVGLFQYLLIYI